ncbi:unnamed protein product [Allacma fusca]|uniref:Cytochrome P450 n=1 Tax=Allacma fusca TaxID=39272 RepID=A0A8J2KPQ9_9HEXA|nr:unnamed protein product [Allacma fusca]
MIPILNLVLFGIFFLVSWKLVNRKKLGKTLKGPFALPLVGNALSLGKTPHVVMGKWAQKYGKIYQMYIGHDR